MPGLDITPALPAGRQFVESYGDGGFTVSGRHYQGSIVLLPTETRPWDTRRAEDIAASTLLEALAGEATGGILIIGCGRTHQPPPQALIASLRSSGYAVEWMDTGAACRTCNVLILENRAVAAALIAVD